MVHPQHECFTGNEPGHISALPHPYLGYYTSLQLDQFCPLQVLPVGIALLCWFHASASYSTALFSTTGTEGTAINLALDGANCHQHWQLLETEYSPPGLVEDEAELEVQTEHMKYGLRLMLASTLCVACRRGRGGRVPEQHWGQRVAR